MTVSSYELLTGPSELDCDGRIGKKGRLLQRILKQVCRKTQHIRMPFSNAGLVAGCIIIICICILPYLQPSLWSHWAFPTYN